MISIQLQKAVRVTTSFNGFHCWPDAPDIVSFLRSLHRHKFNVKLTCCVAHGDRQLEFFTLQNELNQYIQKVLLPELRLRSTMSCEDLAEMILKHFISKGATIAEVDEDGENAGIVELLALTET